MSAGEHLSLDLATEQLAGNATLTESEALALARTVAEAQGWPFLEPVSITFRRHWFRRGGTWTILTHFNVMGGNVGITLDDVTRQVVEKRFVNLPR